MPNGNTANTSSVGFAQKYLEAQEFEQNWRTRNAQSPYSEDIKKVFAELANYLFPNDEFNSVAYQEAILESLAGTLSIEIGVYDFWKKLAELGCVMVEIESGHLVFWKKDQSKIDITPFTRAIIFDAHSSFYKVKRKMRLAKIADARQQLIDLKQELTKKLLK